jgi:hypothetical protein
MAEPDAGPDLQQLRILSGRECVGSDLELAPRPPDKPRVPQRVGRGEKHQLLRRLRQLADAPQVVVLDLGRKVLRGRKLEATRQLRGGHVSRQLQESERIATVLGDDAVADTIVEPAGYRGREQGARIFLLQPFESDLG